MANCFPIPVFVGSVSDILHFTNTGIYIFPYFIRELPRYFYAGYFFMGNLFRNFTVIGIFYIWDISAINRHFFYGEYSFIVNCSEYFSEQIGIFHGGSLSSSYQRSQRSERSEFLGKRKCVVRQQESMASCPSEKFLCLPCYSVNLEKEIRRIFHFHEIQNVLTVNRILRVFTQIQITFFCGAWNMFVVVTAFQIRNE